MERNNPARGRQRRSKPIDLHAMEQYVREGILSTREIGKRLGCSHTSVQKLQAQHGWERDLNARIREKADSIVAKASFLPRTAALSSASDMETILSSGAMLASVRLEHRRVIAKLRAMAESLIHEMDAVGNQNPEVIAMVWDALSMRDGRSEPALLDAAKLIASIPGRSNVMKTLAETMRTIVGMEREAFGLDTSAGTDGRPMVIIRDFTGRGDPDSPRAGTPPEPPPPAPPALPMVELDEQREVETEGGDHGDR